MAITYIDFYAENPIHDKTLDNTNIYDAITGNSTNILDITNPSQDVRITNTEGIILDANNDISLTTQADYNQIVVGNQNITTVGTMYINYFGAVPSPSFTPKHVYFGQYASTPTTVHFIDNSTIKIPGGLNGQVLSTDGSGNLSFIAQSGGGVSDGDKGDITVSGGGTVWTIDNDVVTYAKMQHASGLSIIGRSSNTSGTLAEITSTANGQVLHRSGSNLHFGTIGDSSITASSITYSRLQDVSTNNRLLGRSTAGAGVVQEITIGSGLTLTAGTLTASGGTGAPDIVRTKTVNETVVNSSTLQNDDELRITSGIPATGHYYFELNLLVSAGGSGKLLKARANNTSGIDGLWWPVYWPNPWNSTTFNQMAGFDLPIIRTSFDTNFIKIFGYVQFTSTSDTWYFDWAQGVADFQNTRVLAGSQLKMWKV